MHVSATVGKVRGHVTESYQNGFRRFASEGNARYTVATSEVSTSEVSLFIEEQMMEQASETVKRFNRRASGQTAQQQALQQVRNLCF